MSKKVVLILLLAFALGGVAYYYSTAATPVEAVTVGRADILHSVTETGYVQASKNADIYALQGGRISGLSVSVGQSVEKDQVLMVLENRDLVISTQQVQVQLNQAKAAVGSAQAALKQGKLELVEIQTQFERTQELYDTRSISTADFEAGKSSLAKSVAKVEAQEQTVKASQTQVNSYRSLLAGSQQKERDLKVTSPLSGMIMKLPVQEDRVVSGGTLLAQISAPDELEIKANLLSDDLREVRLGQKVKITAPVLGEQSLDGEVQQIYPQAEEEQSALGLIQRRVPTIIKLMSTGNLKPGYEVRVTILTGGKTGVVAVPRESVLTAADGRKQVMLISGDLVKYRDIATGLMDAKRIQITEGLQEGDLIVRDAGLGLKADARVKVK